MYDYSDYARYYNSSLIDMTGSSNAVAGILAGFGIVTWIVTMVLAILTIVSMWKIFKKAGKPGWAAIIPIYNVIVLFQISGLNPWLILLFIVPFVNFIAIPVLMILLYVKLAKAFGKSGGFAVGLIFLNVIFMPILAFSDTKYQGAE